MLVNGFRRHAAVSSSTCDARGARCCRAPACAWRATTGLYVTSLEMAGCSVTVSAVDAGTLALWDAPVHTAALRWECDARYLT